MTALRSFNELSAREVLALAMDIERNNAARFDSLASMFSENDPDTERLLQNLHLEELAHLEELERVWRELYGAEPPPNVREEDVAEVIEAVDLDDGEHAIFDGIDSEHALALVARSEAGARDFYRRALDGTSDADVKSVFERLLRLEEEHLRSVEHLLKGDES